MLIITIRDIVGLAVLAILLVGGGGYIAWASIAQWLARRLASRKARV